MPVKKYNLFVILAILVALLLVSPVTAHCSECNANKGSYGRGPHSSPCDKHVSHEGHTHPKCKGSKDEKPPVTAAATR